MVLALPQSVAISEKSTWPLIGLVADSMFTMWMDSLAPSVAVRSHLMGESARKTRMIG